MFLDTPEDEVPGTLLYKLIIEQTPYQFVRTVYTTGDATLKFAIEFNGVDYEKAQIEKPNLFMNYETGFILDPERTVKELFGDIPGVFKINCYKA